MVEGAPDELKHELRGDTVQIELEPAAVPAAVELLGRVTGLADVASDGGSLRARAGSGARAVPAVLAALEDGGIAVDSVIVARPSLDDVYLRYAGRSFEVAA